MQDKDDDWKKIFDKTFQDNYTREEKIAAYKESIERRRRHKAYSHRRGFVIINDGVKEKQYDADLPIPEGWKRGKAPRKRVQV